MTEQSKNTQTPQCDKTDVMQRFQEFIDDYERNIAKEKVFLSGLDPIETCDDILYELQIRRDVLKKCYEHVFNVA